ncbi:MAG: metallophosphoesterase [Solirubrobacteraceae bacterium]
MDTLVISDLHLGSRARHDVLRIAGAQERLLAAIDGVQRLVLLGDTVELVTRHPRRALSLAEPVIRALGRRLGPEREVIVVPGNHDAALARSWVLAQGRSLRPCTEVSSEASAALSALAAWLNPARMSVSYPGVWLGERIWATHGHYLDRHLLPDSSIGLPRPVFGRPTHADPIDYEHGRKRGRGAREPLGSRLLSRPVGTILEASADLVRVMAVPHVPRLLMNRGLAPVTARVIDSQMRHAAVPAMARVARRLGIDADWVLFGHVHRRGPIGDEAWPADGAMRLVNTGSWVYDPLLLDRATPPNPYWPGGAVLLRDGAAPQSVGLLDGMTAAELRSAGRGTGRELWNGLQLPRLLIWTPALIVVFVLAGIVIAIVRLA